MTSHRAERCHDATARWLEEIDLHYDELYCSFDKVSRCVELNIEVLIDVSRAGIVSASKAFSVWFEMQEQRLSGRTA